MSDEELTLQKDKLVKTLATMFDFLGLQGTFRVEDRNQKLAVKIASEDAGRIIGRKGQTLESLQLLVNRIMFKENEECPRIVMDIDGYADGERERRSSRRNSDGAEGETAEEGDRGPRPERRERRPRERRGGESGPRFTEEQLTQQALDTAKEVKKWGEPVKLPEMNAHDRRIIHVTLQDDPEITTESEGEGALKKVIVSLKKAE